MSQFPVRKIRDQCGSVAAWPLRGEQRGAQNRTEQDSGRARARSRTQALAVNQTTATLRNKSRRPACLLSSLTLVLCPLAFQERT